ncbi:terpene synthase 10-like [Gossypium australe]|uniref:Terpene synthase 10-like n=1 Tax=Gossypium australe TaxID=47621 RepID=A0A5B6VUY3_9ROSI|nr:terpene synthase 10-like [Gossypium australe]
MGLISDTSLNGLNFILMKKGKVMVYTSSQIKLQEKNYPKYDLELTIIKDLNLTQSRWFELIKDPDLVIDYHSGKRPTVHTTILKQVTRNSGYTVTF